MDEVSNIYLSGTTGSNNYPTFQGLNDSSNGNDDAFITKLTPSGNDLSFSTYLGGDLFDAGTSVTVDLSGNSYVTGNTSSTNFPTVNA